MRKYLLVDFQIVLKKMCSLVVISQKLSGWDEILEMRKPRLEFGPILFLKSF